MSAPAQVVPALFGKDGSPAASRLHRARPLPSPSPASGGFRHRAQRAGSEWPLGPDRLRLRRQRQDLHLPAVHAHGRARRAGAEWPLRPSRLRRGRRRRDLHLSAARVRDPARHAGAEWPQSGLASDGDAEIFASPPGALRTELGVQAPVGLLGPAGFFAGGNAEVFISRLLALKTELITEAPSGLLGPDGFAADGNADFFIFGCARSGPSSARRRRVASWTRPASPQTATPSSPPPSCSRSRPGSGASDCDRASVGTAPSGRCCRVHGAGLLIALGGLSRGVRAPAAHAAYFLMFGICVVWVAARVALSLSSSPRAFPCVTGHPHGRAPHVRHQRPGPSSLSSRMVLSPSSSSDDGLLPSWRAFRPRASAAGRLHLRLRGRSSA